MNSPEPTPLALPTPDEVLPENVHYAWYSYTMQTKTGTVTYESEDRSRDVQITCISRTVDHGLGWKDVQYRGRVYTGRDGRVSFQDRNGSPVRPTLKLTR